MRFSFFILIAGLLTLPAQAQPWYARGTFGTPSPPPGDPGGPLSEWNDLSYPMVNEEGGHYTSTVGGFFPGLDFEFKIAEEDFDPSMPSQNGKVTTDNNGEINFHLWDNTSWSDGWYPKNQRRVGYDDHQQFDWEIAGTFNEWPQAADPTYFLTDQTNGLHTGSFTFNAGVHEFKFRKQGSWDTSIGNGDFSGSGANNSFRVWENGETWNFELDLPNGRWRAYTAAPNPDQNSDEYVDAADYVTLRKLNNTQPIYDAWKKHFAEGPPPPPPGWYARGQFTTPAWDSLEHEMQDQGNGYYTKTITGLTAGQDYEFKVARSDWSQSAPNDNAKVRADANGTVGLHFWESTSWADDWMPDSRRRVGYVDHQLFDWEVAGEFNGWNGGVDWYLQDQGNGLHTASFTFNTADTYDFKFRQRGSWDTSIGNGDFSNYGGNNSFTVTTPGEVWNFELDLPNGRWRVYESGGGESSGVPEPGSLMLALVIGFVGCCFARRR